MVRLLIPFRVPNGHRPRRVVELAGRSGRRATAGTDPAVIPLADLTAARPSAASGRRPSRAEDGDPRRSSRIARYHSGLPLVPSFRSPKSRD
jgi:hypothetical protein